MIKRIGRITISLSLAGIRLMLFFFGVLLAVIIFILMLFVIVGVQDTLWSVVALINLLRTSPDTV